MNCTQPATGSGTSVPARELAQRISGTDVVLLLWHPDSQQLELAVLDVTTGVSLHLEVAPGNAIDAFNHPFAYVTRRENSKRVALAGASGGDG
jgi:hypothetical protein